MDSESEDKANAGASRAREGMGWHQTAGSRGQHGRADLQERERENAGFGRRRCAMIDEKERSGGESGGGKDELAGDERLVLDPPDGRDLCGGMNQGAGKSGGALDSNQRTYSTRPAAETETRGATWSKVAASS